ncbi:MAG: hypothetical protein Q9159_006051 [Coniocarpon cinnabarinum]
MALLSLWSSVKARQHTTPAGHPPTGYNSSASAVCAIWLFFQIFLVNSLRSKLPQLIFAAIIYAIFANIALSYGVQFPTTAAAENFVKNLLKAFLTGFSLATGTHFVVFPVTMRKPVFGQMAGLLGAMRGVIKAQSAYMRAFEDERVSSHEERSSSESSSEKASVGIHKKSSIFNTSRRSKAKTEPHVLAMREEAIKAAVSGLHTLLGKLQGDIPFAKREMVYGKFNSEDIRDTMTKMRLCALPLLGLGSVIDLLRRAARFGGWEDMLDASKNDAPATTEQEKQDHDHIFGEWQAVMRTLRKPFALITDAMDEALEHVLLTLEFKPPPKQAKKAPSATDDPERQDDSTAPGQPGFGSKFEHKIQTFYESRSLTLRTWCEQQGIDLPQDSFDVEATENVLLNVSSQSGRRHRGQIYTILYGEYLLYASAKAMLDMVKYADSKVADGTMKKKRLITPGAKRLIKWFRDVFLRPELSGGGESDLTGSQQQPFQVDFGEGYTTHDPEHLAPRNTFERIGNVARMIPNVFRSEHCTHGFRAACATLSIGIVCYLKDTQHFFIAQRMVWAQIMVAFSMQRTAGQSVFQFVLRTAGTFFAMVASYVIWYIVDGHRAGVIVFEFLWLACCFWVLFNKPRYAIMGILAAITSILIIGYELQVQTIGVKMSTSNGQPAYPLYELAPYRLATVVGGIFVAYFWTVFPYPISEHTEFRRDVSSALHLLARYYTIVHETVKSRSNGTEGDPASKTSPAYILEKARHNTFIRSQILLTQLRDVSSFSRWQVDFGGRFPAEIYNEMTDRLERTMRVMSLIGYASTSFRQTHTDAENGNAEWLDSFKKLLKEVDPTSHAISMRLQVLSGCLQEGRPLPPYIPRFEPFHLAQRIYAIDKDVLSFKHLAEPGYAAFAVMQIASKVLVEELNGLTQNVRDLCGEMDFSVKLTETSA